jgi:uncharacterized protein Yka (UPF0111/DUF47 family)
VLSRELVFAMRLIDLLPRDDSFFPLVCRQTEVLREASRLLRSEACADAQSSHSLAIQVHELEHRGDDLIREILSTLNRNLICWLEPEDGRLLASRLDDVLDGIEDVAYRIAEYRIPGLPPQAIRLCQILQTCVDLIGEAIRRFDCRNPEANRLAGIDQLEHEADIVFRSGIGDLFQSEVEPLRLLKLKEIYEFLESTIDRCKDVADVLGNIAANAR